MSTPPAIGSALLPATFATSDGASVTLESGPLILMIDRGYWCSHCREQLERLNAISDDLRVLGVRLVSVSADTAEGCARAAAATVPEIEVLRDPDAAWIIANGLLDVEELSRPTAVPAMFVVDGSGRVRYRYLGRHAGDRPTTSLLLLAAEAVLDA
ncbi:MAG: redoxin domain-containing protein [Thermomicrobiales bacterium]|nr:redoxin domain-containing protein [Thermomicrobiales bacterium]